MLFKNILLTPLVAAGFASAAPSKEPATFQVMSLRSTTPIHFARFQAANNHIVLHDPHTKAKCKAKSQETAVFKIWDGKLYLYNEKTTQQIFVDRSKKGQGKIGYTTNQDKVPSTWEREGWKISKDSDLTFNDLGLQACPNDDGTWRVWVDNGVKNPEGNKKCLGLLAQTVKDDKPNSCTYTHKKFPTY